MKKSLLAWSALLGLVTIPILACGPAAWGGSAPPPTPTKTPTPLKPLTEVSNPTPTPTVLILPTPTPFETQPTETPLPPPPPTDTPAAETPAQPAEESNTGEGAAPAGGAAVSGEGATQTTGEQPAAPPPPPADTPAPPPPADTPAPPPPSNPGPIVIIELPDGDTYGLEDEVKVIITVKDSDGVSAFSWGVFTQNNTALIGGDENCHNAPECRIEEEFTTALQGAFQIGVEAKDSTGQGVIEVTQLYVG